MSKRELIRGSCADQKADVVVIENIEKKIKSTSDDATVTEEKAINEVNTDEKIACPKCGSPLVLRTTKKGENAGKQFYGCSSFPKCRYIKNIDK